jgi:CsoR family transcriptional regulator, copper-sensing transcriptional repressor
MMKAAKRAKSTRAASAEKVDPARCGCGTGATERKALHVDPALKTSNLTRLRRIEGQVRGLQHMIEHDRYCADIVIQISSVQEALRGVARNLMRNHLHHCAAESIRHGSEQEASAMYDELLELVYKHLR